MQFARINNAIRNAVISLVGLAAISLLAHNFSGAATTTSTAPARHYYLTKATLNGNQALTACASGYHFASFTELLDPTVLTYNKTLGRSNPDDGAGPPVAWGWVRTGWSSNSALGTIVTNCNLWTSGATADYGLAGGFLPPYLTPSQTFSPAVDFYDQACDNSNGNNLGVWCV